MPLASSYAWWIILELHLVYSPAVLGYFSEAFAYLSRKDSGWKKQAEVKPAPWKFYPSCHKALAQVASQLLWYLPKMNAFHRNCLSLVSCLFRRIHTTSTCSGHSEHGTAPKAIQWSILRLTTFSDQWLGEIQGMPWEYESVGGKPRVLGSHAQRMLNILHASSKWTLPSYTNLWF